MPSNVVDFPGAGAAAHDDRQVVVNKTTAIGPTAAPKFVTLEVPAFFPVERLAKFFGECGYQMQSTPGGTVRVIPNSGAYKFHQPGQRILSRFGVGLPHNRWRKHLLPMREENKAKK